MPAPDPCSDLAARSLRQPPPTLMPGCSRSCVTTSIPSTGSDGVRSRTRTARMPPGSRLLRNKERVLTSRTSTRLWFTSPSTSVRPYSWSGLRTYRTRGRPKCAAWPWGRSSAGSTGHDLGSLRCWLLKMARRSARIGRSRQPSKVHTKHERVGPLAPPLRHRLEGTSRLILLASPQHRPAHGSVRRAWLRGRASARNGRRPGSRPAADGRIPTKSAAGREARA